MAVHESAAVVLWRRDLGETDRLVELYSRRFGKLRGVARGARRPRSRLTGALEPFTLGALVFFDTGRSELVRIDHFDVLEPFAALREDLDRLGRAAWTLECVARLTADRDPQAALFGLLVRTLRALDGRLAPGRAAACFGLRAMDLLGHRLRLDRCVGCGRLQPLPDPALDVAAGGLLCRACGTGRAIPVSAALLGALRRLRAASWEEGLRLRLPPGLAAELERLLEEAMAQLAGAPSRAARFIRETRAPFRAGPARPLSPPGSRPG